MSYPLLADELAWQSTKRRACAHLHSLNVFRKDVHSTVDELENASFFARLYIGKLIALDVARFKKEFPDKIDFSALPYILIY